MSDLEDSYLTVEAVWANPVFLAYFFVWCHDVVPSIATKQLMTSCCTMHGATLTTATKVVRARRDRGLGCTEKDWSEETEDWALISAIKFLSKMIFHYYNPVKLFWFSYESLALQD